MKLTEIRIFPNCRSRPAGPQSMLCVVKGLYRPGVTGYPSGLSGTERVRVTYNMTKRPMNAPAVMSLTGWNDTLIPIDPPPSQTRASTPAVSYMSFSATPSR